MLLFIYFFIFFFYLTVYCLLIIFFLALLNSCKNTLFGLFGKIAEPYGLYDNTADPSLSQLKIGPGFGNGENKLIRDENKMFRASYLFSQQFLKGMTISPYNKAFFSNIANNITLPVNTLETKHKAQ